MTRTEKANQILLLIYELTNGDIFEEIERIYNWESCEGYYLENEFAFAKEIPAKTGIDNYGEFCKLILQLHDQELIITKMSNESSVRDGYYEGIYSDSEKVFDFYDIKITEKGTEKYKKLMEENKKTETEKANEILLWIYDKIDGDEFGDIPLVNQNNFPGSGIEAYNEFEKLLVKLKKKGLVEMEDNNPERGESIQFKDLKLTSVGIGKCKLLKDNVDLIPKDIKQTKMKEPKIFISHSSDDKDVVEKAIDILEAIGVPNSKIFCSSFEGYGVKLGEDFLERIKRELNNDVMVLFILTSNFYTSPISLCEMGASWVKTNKQILILIPPFEYSQIKGVFPTLHSMKINEQSKLNSLKDSVIEFMGLNILNTSIWERKRNKILKEINEILNKTISKPPTIENNPNFWMGKS